MNNYEEKWWESNMRNDKKKRLVGLFWGMLNTTPVIFRDYLQKPMEIPGPPHERTGIFHTQLVGGLV